ncbi:hypothetical protein SLS57_012473 [Botryosphaeria dothidea]
MAATKSHDGIDFTSTIHNDTYSAIDPRKADHRGHRVFVTGASKGIGKRTAIAFAEAGASQIAIGARSALDQVEQAALEGAKLGGHPPPRVLKIKLDVMDLANVEAAAEAILQEFGGLDILINNAGYLEEFRPLAESDPKEWWRTWEMNVRSVYFCLRAFLPILQRGGEKTIINVGSIGAHHFMPGGSAYQTSKLALLRLTEFVMVDHGNEGILAYTVHPGGIPTDISERMPSNVTSKVELAGNTLVWLTQCRKEYLASRYVSCTWDMPELEARKNEILRHGKLKIQMTV